MILIFIAFSFNTYFNISKNHTILKNSTDNFSVEIVDNLEIDGNYLKTQGYINNEKVIVNYNLKNEKEKEYFKNNFFGGTIVSSGVIEDISVPKNYYQFNFQEYNENRQIYKKYTINEIYEINNTFTKNYLKLLNLRNNIIKNTADNIITNKKGYIEALVFGYRFNIGKDDLDFFKKLGITHLLAISGLHIAVLLYIVYKFLSVFEISKNTKNLIIIIILILYSFIAGLSPSVIRASLMIIFYIVLRKAKIDSLEAICIAFISMIFYNPYYIKDLGFIYSFFITFCLLLSTDFINSDNNKIKKIIKVILIAFISSIPINIAYFYHFNFGSMIANIIIAPYFTLFLFPFILISYFVYILNYNLYNEIFNPILNILFYILDKLLMFCEKFYLKINVGNLPTVYIYTIFIISLILLWLLNKKYYKNFLILFCIFIVGIYYLKPIINNKVVEKLNILNQEVYFFRYNNNNLLVNTSNNINYKYTDYRKKEKSYDIITEYDNLLSFEGLNKFETLVLTKTSLKNIGLSSTLISNNKIKKLLTVEDIISNKNVSEIINIAKFKNITIKILKKDEVYNLSNIKITNKKEKLEINYENKIYGISKDRE